MGPPEGTCASEPHLTAAATPFQRARGWAAAALAARALLFAALLAWYVHSYIGARVVFWVQNDMFLWNFRFARDFLRSAGGPAEWLGKLLLQSYYYGWAGAAVIAVVAWLLFLATIAFMKRIARRGAAATWMIPAILLAVLYSQYLFRISTAVGVALAVAAAAAYAWAPAANRWLRLVLFALLSLLVYYVAGVAYYVFAACCLIFELLVARRLLMGLAFLAVAPAVKVGLDYALSAFAAPVPYMELEAPAKYQGRLLAGVLCLYLYFPVCALFLAAWPAGARLLKRVVKRRPKTDEGSESESPPRQSRKERKEPHKQEPPARRQRTPRAARAWAMARWWAVTLPLLAAGGGAAYLSVHRDAKTLTEMDYFSAHHRWQELLEKVPDVPPQYYSQYVNFDINRALYHTGRLPYEMFSYRQRHHLFLPPHAEQYPVAGLCRLFDFYLQLGRVNEAEHFAHEELEARKSAGALKRLALTKMIKGERAAARVFLNVLRDDLVHGRWARDYLRRLGGKEDLSGDPEIARARSLRIDQEDAHEAYRLEEDAGLASSVQRQLVSLCRRNPRNQMAVEYLLALCLLDRQLPVFVDAFDKLDVASFYRGVPPHYEEAMIIYALAPARSEQHKKHKAKHVVISEAGVTVCGRRISEATVRKSQRLGEIERQCWGLNNAAARAAAARELGRTYFFYYCYGHGASR